MPSLPELSEPLADGLVVLRAAAERDIPEILIAYQDDPGLHVALGEERPPSGAALGRRAERAEAERREGVALTLAMTELGDDTIMGEVRVHTIDWENRRAELSVWVSAPARGRGYATRGLALTSCWLLVEAGLARVEMMIDPANEPALRAAKAAGFTAEGVIRGRARLGSAGKPPGRVDNVVLSRLPADLRP